jgi:hypothetical protein
MFKQEAEYESRKVSAGLKDLYLSLRKELPPEAISELQETVPTELINDGPSILIWLKHAFAYTMARARPADQDFEPVIQKLEAEVRQHIRVQH